MADFRAIYTKIWKDGWFMDLEPEAKLLWIYLFSNEQATVAGIYELPLKFIAFETGLDAGYCIDTLSSFEQHGRIRYQDGILWVRNLRKYNETKSPKVQTRIQKDFEAVPDGIVKYEYAQAYGIDTVLIPYPENESETDTDTDTIQRQTETDTGGYAAAVFAAYENNIGQLTPHLSEAIGGAIDDYPVAWIVEAIGIAVERNNRNWRYIAGILRNWQKEGKGSPNKNGTGPSPAEEAWATIFHHQKGWITPQEGPVLDTVRATGGWPRYKSCSERELPFLKKEFIAEYPKHE